MFSGDSGAGFKGSSAPIINPVQPGQTQAAYDQSQEALKKQAAFAAALSGANGVGNQSQVYNQLQGVAAGTGPNPAQAMLNNATGANIASTGALMAGQRGASANPGLIARQAAMQGAATQQSAVGQAAALEAQQRLNAINSAGGIAGQQVNAQGAATMGLNQAQQAEQQALLNAQAAANSANVNMASNINNVNAGIAQGNQEFQKNIVGGLASGISPALAGAGPAAGGGGGGSAATAGAFMAKGGEVSGPKSKAGQHLKSVKVPVKVSPGEVYIPPEKAEKVAAKKESPLKAGQKIPGKAKVPGDSLKNDTVNRKLEAGGIVIPRSVVNSKNDKKIGDFVRAVMAKQGLAA